MSTYNIPKRPRRLRQNPSIRGLVRETQVTADDLIQPLFVIEAGSEVEAIASMPGQNRLPLGDALYSEIEKLIGLGVPRIALFPKLDVSFKTDCGKEAQNPDTLILRAIRELKKRFGPDVTLFADIALDPYTSHGHDGVLNAAGTDVDNDATLALLESMAVLHGEAGVDFVAPSDMMDGRCGVIREALDAAGHINTGILAYSAKFASAYYGPFRDAVGSTQKVPISKKTYQLDPANAREAMLETMLDEAEASDMIMVKPAGAYLDIIARVREQSLAPIAAYQVSGEYAQIHAAAQLGWLDYEKIRDEALLAIKRAGADIILTYFAGEFAAEQKKIAEAK